MMGWKFHQGARHVAGGEMHPGAVVGMGSEPATSMGAIPVPVIEKDAYINIGDQIHIGSGYHHHRRGCREYERGRKTDVDVDMHSRHSILRYIERQKRPDRKRQ